jgi:hypothetical protein
MINKALSLLLILVLLLSSCTSNTSKIPTTDNSAVGQPEALGYDFVIFDSDGDGVKDDIAELTCLGMSGFGLKCSCRVKTVIEKYSLRSNMR